MNKPKPTCPFSQAPCPQSVEHCPLWMPEGQCCALVAIALGLSRLEPQVIERRVLVDFSDECGGEAE